MNGYRGEKSSSCYFHPKEAVVGVCALCLNQRLLVLASKQTRHNSSSSATGNNRKAQDFTHRKTPINFPKIFAFSSSLLSRFAFRNPRSCGPDDDRDASTSQEDSFISIKFGDNGAASWDKGKGSKVSLEHCTVSWNHHDTTKELPKEKSKCAIEHPKTPPTLSWRKRIGQILQLIRFKRSSRRHATSKVDGVMVVDKGWVTMKKERM